MRRACSRRKSSPGSRSRGADNAALRPSGQILYDPRGFAVTRLAALRRSIEHPGLHRERIPEGFDWRQEKTPAASRPLSWSADSLAAA